MMAKKATRSKKPAASKAAPPPASQAAPQVTRCAKCGSTERQPYRGEPRVIAQGGVHQGQSYTHVVFRNTACAECGQHRCDRSYETGSPAA